jgi:hypothetical protein
VRTSSKPTLAGYSEFGIKGFLDSDLEDVALILHDARIVSVSYPRAKPKGEGWGPIACYPNVSLIVSMDTVKLALRADSLAERMAAELDIT